MSKETTKFSASYVAKIGIFSALCYVLYLIRTPLSFWFPFWLVINLSDVPALISGFMLGPLAGVLTITVKILLKLPFTSTACVGELADYLIGLAFVLPSSLVYKHHKDVKHALYGMILGAVCSIIVAILANVFILIPFYLFVQNWKLSTLVEASSGVIKGITESNFYVYYSFFAVLPFNALRCVVAGGITFLVYKKISILMHKF